MKLFGLTITKAAPTGLSAVHSQSILGIIRESFAGAWQRNITIDDQKTLLAFSAVYACISRIANDISILRPMLMLVEKGIWAEVEENSPYLPVLRKPNRYQTRIQFLLYWITAKLMYGNFYALKDRDQRGIVTDLYPLDSRLVTPLVAPDGAVFYELNLDYLSGVREQKIVPASEIIHDRMMTLWHPLIGVSPIYACGASATQGNRIQANSAKFFENMSRPSGHLTAPATIDEVTAARLQLKYETGMGGGNLGRLLVTGDGLKYEPMTIPANDAQLIEQQKWTVVDVIRCFHIPLHKIGEGPMPSFNNVGALNQNYYTECLQSHIESIELLFDEGLSLSNKYGTELDLEGLLRMDPKSRAETNQINVGAGVFAPNEARFRENLKPVVGGESPMAQQQNFSLAALAKRDAKEDPFAPAKSPEPAALPAPAAANDDPAEAAKEFDALMETIRKGLEYAPA